MSKTLNSFERQLCDIQGRLFELALKKRYDSPSFIKTFMNSETAAALDLEYDRLQWAGEEYILDNLEEEAGGLKKAGISYTNEVVFWAGYTYRYWHFLTGESSKEIYHQADAQIMDDSYFGFHTLDVSMAVDDLKEIYKQKQEGTDMSAAGNAEQK